VRKGPPVLQRLRRTVSSHPLQDAPKRAARTGCPIYDETKLPETSLPVLQCPEPQAGLLQHVGVVSVRSAAIPWKRKLLSHLLASGLSYPVLGNLLCSRFHSACMESREALSFWRSGTTVLRMSVMRCVICMCSCSGASGGTATSAGKP